MAQIPGERFEGHTSTSFGDSGIMIERSAAMRPDLRSLADLRATGRHVSVGAESPGSPCGRKGTVKDLLQCIRPSVRREGRDGSRKRSLTGEL
jgi:hypothetical protein